MGQQYGQQAKDSLERVVAHKKAKAVKQFGSIDEAYDALRNEDLNTAKAAVYEGMSYVDMAGCEDDYTAKLTYYSKAATAYGKAHCYAQLAQNNPSKLIREGAEYEVY